jgi:hypothetical protein
MYAGIAAIFFTAFAGAGFYYFFIRQNSVTSPPSPHVSTPTSASTPAPTVVPKLLPVVKKQKLDDDGETDVKEGFEKLNKELKKYFEKPSSRKKIMEFCTNSKDMNVKDVGNLIAEDVELTKLFQFIPVQMYSPALAQWIQNTSPYKHPELVEELRDLAEQYDDDKDKKKKLLFLIDRTIDGDVKRNNLFTNASIANYLINKGTLTQWNFHKIPMYKSKENYPALMAYVHTRIKGGLNIISETDTTNKPTNEDVKDTQQPTAAPTTAAPTTAEPTTAAPTTAANEILANYPNVQQEQPNSAAPAASVGNSQGVPIYGQDKTKKQLFYKPLKKKGSTKNVYKNPKQNP